MRISMLILSISHAIGKVNGAFYTKNGIATDTEAMPKFYLR